MYFRRPEPQARKYIESQDSLYLHKSKNQSMYFGDIDPRLAKYIDGAQQRRKYIEFQNSLYFWHAATRSRKHIEFLMSVVPEIVLNPLNLYDLFDLFLTR